MPAIPNPQHSAFNQHARASFIHLTNANDRVLQARDLIHARQDLVLAVAPGEDDGALATDVDDGAVSELDGTLHHPVKLGEHVAATRHVVRRTRVEVPDGNKSLYLVFVGVVFFQHLGLLLEQLWQQDLGCSF
jgi:hypothetical protein